MFVFFCSFVVTQLFITGCVRRVTAVPAKNATHDVSQYLQQKFRIRKQYNIGLQVGGYDIREGCANIYGGAYVICSNQKPRMDPKTMYSPTFTDHIWFRLLQYVPP